MTVHSYGKGKLELNPRSGGERESHPLIIHRKRICFITDIETRVTNSPAPFCQIEYNLLRTNNKLRFYLCYYFSKPELLRKNNLTCQGAASVNGAKQKIDFALSLLSLVVANLMSSPSCLQRRPERWKNIPVLKAKTDRSISTTGQRSHG